VDSKKERHNRVIIHLLRGVRVGREFQAQDDRRVWLGRVGPKIGQAVPVKVRESKTALKVANLRVGDHTKKGESKSRDAISQYETKERKRGSILKHHQGNKEQRRKKSPLWVTLAIVASRR